MIDIQPFLARLEGIRVVELREGFSRIWICQGVFVMSQALQHILIGLLAGQPQGGMGHLGLEAGFEPAGMVGLGATGGTNPMLVQPAHCSDDCPGCHFPQ